MNVLLFVRLLITRGAHTLEPDQTATVNRVEPLSTTDSEHSSIFAIHLHAKHRQSRTISISRYEATTLQNISHAVTCPVSSLEHRSFLTYVEAKTSRLFRPAKAGKRYAKVLPSTMRSVSGKPATGRSNYHVKHLCNMYTTTIDVVFNVRHVCQ